MYTKVQQQTVKLRLIFFELPNLNNLRFSLVNNFMYRTPHYLVTLVIHCWRNKTHNCQRKLKKNFYFIKIIKKCRKKIVCTINFYVGIKSNVDNFDLDFCIINLIIINLRFI